MEENNLTIAELLHIVVIDIDIKLFREKNQIDDKDRIFYTKDEVRKQLIQTHKELCTVLKFAGYDINKEIRGDYTSMLDLLKTSKN